MKNSGNMPRIAPTSTIKLSWPQTGPRLVADLAAASWNLAYHLAR